MVNNLQLTLVTWHASSLDIVENPLQIWINNIENITFLNECFMCFPFHSTIKRTPLEIVQTFRCFKNEKHNNCNACERYQFFVVSDAWGLKYLPFTMATTYVNTFMIYSLPILSCRFLILEGLEVAIFAICFWNAMFAIISTKVKTQHFKTILPVHWECITAWIRVCNIWVSNRRCFSTDPTYFCDWI